MQIWFLSNGSYSLKNCHNPFGKAIQPPPPLRQNSGWTLKILTWALRGPLVHGLNVKCKMTKCQMSKMKCQMSIRLHFCWSVPLEFLRSFLELQLTWISKEEVLLPMLVFELIHHHFMLLQILAHHLHNMGILKKHISECHFLLLFNYMPNAYYVTYCKQMFPQIKKITLINGLRFFSWGLDLLPRRAIGYFMAPTSEEPKKGTRMIVVCCL